MVKIDPAVGTRARIVAAAFDFLGGLCYGNDFLNDAFRIWAFIAFQKPPWRLSCRLSPA